LPERVRNRENRGERVKVEHKILAMKRNEIFDGRCRGWGRDMKRR